MCRISGIVIEHGKDDFGYWEGFNLTEAEENAIWNILSKHDTEGCSLRGTRKEIAEEIGVIEMTKLETMKCEKLLNEAIRNAETANEEFYKAGNSYDTVEKHILKTKAWNHIGYAQGINQALVVIGFKHEQMAELSKLIS